MPCVRPFCLAISPSMMLRVPSLALTPLSVFEATPKSWSTYFAFLAFGFAEATLCATVKRCLCFVGGTRATTRAAQQ